MQLLRKSRKILFKTPLVFLQKISQKHAPSSYTNMSMLHINTRDFKLK